MSIAKLLRRILVRWDALVVAVICSLPLVALICLGSLWLWENSLLIPFIAGCFGLGIVGAIVRAIAHFKRTSEAPAIQRSGPSVAPDADWGAAERAAFKAAKRRIEARMGEPLDWAALPKAAQEVVDGVARDLKGAGRTTLDFTAPEALLLIERVAARYRDLLRRNVPFSDQISLRTLRFLWRNRERGRLAYEIAMKGYRLGRIALNLPAGLAREIERLIAGGNESYLTMQMVAEAQTMLLEEAAHAAVELYSGRLRFSDAELLEIHLAESDADRAHAAEPLGPLRVLVVGQTSAGKSTLVNALLEDDAAEVDMRATTGALAAYDHEIDGVACRLIDSPGLDGGQQRLDATLREITTSDIVLWTIRANRPGRGPDAALAQAFEAWFRERPERRQPPVIAAVTCVDELVRERWPFPEHALPPDVQQRFAEAVEAVARDVGGLRPIPVRVKTPEWNVEAVRRTLSAALAEAMHVQIHRNRIRLEAERDAGGVVADLIRGGRGVLQGSRTFGGRLVKRTVERMEE